MQSLGQCVALDLEPISQNCTE
uniref:Uncharacterized protein n=1 Tax=Anguilla anguilla TaxID=7936 RepID=A0A0E9PSH3_ANGAN